jgi:transcriptional regulator with XRE-family HTH domain
MNTMITGQRLRAIRALKNLSQAQLAELAGVPANAIAEFETGKRDIRASTIEKLCRALGVTVTYQVDGVTISGP